METHAQDLHKAPGKNFWHYFFEFFMLFLAVSAGFFAENLREHFADQQRAKEYVQSFYQDLKADTARISKVINQDEEKIEALDDIATCYDSVLQNSSSSSWEVRVDFYFFTS